MEISIIILTYNAKEVTIKMLDSLKESLENVSFKYEVIVVDNGSTDGVREELESKQSSEKWFQLIKGENIGFAKGNNVGVTASDKSSKYVLFLNPDIIVEKNTLKIMHEYMESNPSVALSTCRVDVWTGGIDWDCHRGFPTPWRGFCYFSGLEKYFGAILPKLFGGYHLLDKDLTKTHEIDVCLGAFVLIRRIWGVKINWWPTDYFLNGEDVDFCYMVKEIHKGIITYVPTAKIIHYKGASKGTKGESAKITKASPRTKTLQITSGIKSMEIFYRKYYGAKYPWILSQLIYLGIWLLKRKRLLLGKE